MVDPWFRSIYRTNNINTTRHWKICRILVCLLQVVFWELFPYRIDSDHSNSTCWNSLNEWNPWCDYDIYLFCVLAVVAIYTTELVRPVANIATESFWSGDSAPLILRTDIERDIYDISDFSDVLSAIAPNGFPPIVLWLFPSVLGLAIIDWI